MSHITGCLNGVKFQRNLNIVEQQKRASGFFIEKKKDLSPQVVCLLLRTAGRCALTYNQKQNDHST